MLRRFSQVDVFASGGFGGNPVAVVHDTDGLTPEQMLEITAWTNLSEATFLLPPTDDDADYRVRIFCPGRELPFAGHPTLGTCAAWLGAGGRPKQADRIIQQCGAGLIPIRRSGVRLAFAAPPMTRSGPIEADLLAERLRQLERCKCAFGGVTALQFLRELTNAELDQVCAVSQSKLVQRVAPVRRLHFVVRNVWVCRVRQLALMLEVIDGNHSCRLFGKRGDVHDGHVRLASHVEAVRLQAHAETE